MPISVAVEAAAVGAIARSLARLLRSTYRISSYLLSRPIHGSSLQNCSFARAKDRMRKSEKGKERERNEIFSSLSLSLPPGFLSLSLSRFLFCSEGSRDRDTLSLSLTFFLLTVEGEEKMENNFKTRKK